jgi:glycosyltransferase involved in cell wall biosynthesis
VKGRIAVVSATAGSNVGGAETMLHDVATGLAGRGWDVEILTTAAEDIYTWENVAQVGLTAEGDLGVRRFEAVGLTQPMRDRLSMRILAGEKLAMAEQYRWANAGMRVPGLYNYLAEHSRDYRAIICGPYMFWAGLVLADLAPERTILFPCLHDEPFARLELYRFQMRAVRGLWFQTDPEFDLAQSLGLVGDRHAFVGSAVSNPLSVDVEAFRRRYDIEGDYLFFAGRREWGKGWPQLMEDLSFTREVLGKTIPLVTCGVGLLGDLGEQLGVRDIGVVSDVDRASGQAGALAYIQPSAMESFSRTVLEAFQLGTPVIANWHSAVVRWHCERSGAGLTYSNRYEFAECMRLLGERPEVIRGLAQGGPAYVEGEFTWPAVIDRVEASLKEWT